MATAGADGLFDELYVRLHRMCRARLEGGHLNLTPTTLLHEAYLDMARRESSFPDRGRFMAYASRVMRGIIIDYARRRRAYKRGGQFEIGPLEDEGAEPAAEAAELAVIGEALDQLATVEPSLAQLVDLKFFCGFSFSEIAALRGQSERTVQRHWEKARIYLHGVIRNGRSL